ncbi:MAG: WD40/YVTN/BNR-like repeat-containing protein [Halobacteriaceae archaeon]
MDNDACRLYLGTEEGLKVARIADGMKFSIINEGLNGETVRAMAIHPNDPERVHVGCGLRGWGCYHTGDGGATFDTVGFEDRWVWDVTYDPTDPEKVYIGTEPPMLYAHRRGEVSFDAFEDIDDLPSRPDWKFYHEPFGDGHVHGVDIHPDRPNQIFAGVEDGSLIYSRDGGDSWREALVGHDIHRTAIDPSDPDRIFAGAADGLYRSEDAGETWEGIDAFDGHYVHGIYFNERDPGRMYTYAAEDIPLYRSDDGGNSWNAIGERLPSARAADTLVIHPTSPEILFYVGEGSDESGHLFVSSDEGKTWRQITSDLPKVWRVRGTVPP